MKLTNKQLKQMIREALTEMSDDWDHSAHVKQKNPSGASPRVQDIPRDPDASTYVDTPGVEQGIVDRLKKQFGPGGEEMARSIIDAVKKMKENGLI